MIVDTFSNRLKKAMEIRGYKQAYLSELTGIDKSLISNYLNGNYKAKQDKLYILAKALNVNEAWLMGYDVSINSNKQQYNELGEPVTPIPILGVVKAGYDYLAQENHIGTVNVKLNNKNPDDYFALKITGDSMEPLLIENDIVLVKKQTDCENGNIAVILINRR